MYHGLCCFELEMTRRNLLVKFNNPNRLLSIYSTNNTLKVELSFCRKRLPKDAPDGCTQSLVGAIERALHDGSNRKGKHIFEPTPGMTFDCVSEAQEFYNIYSWEVSFGTKKGGQIW